MVGRFPAPGAPDSPRVMPGTMRFKKLEVVAQGGSNHPGALHEHEHQLAAYCATCERWAVLDLARLIAEGRGDIASSQEAAIQLASGTRRRDSRGRRFPQSAP